MPKQRHRKRVRTARLNANPLGHTEAEAPTTINGASAAAPSGSVASTSSSTATATAQPAKVGKKEADASNLIEQLKSEDDNQRIWATSALSNVFLTLPPGTQRLLLSKNLVGLLIERLTDSNDHVAVEALGTLRNLAVATTSSLVSEMHNKKVLVPLVTHHLPILIQLLPERLGRVPRAAPATAPLPSTAEDRKRVEAENDSRDTRHRLYWDWCENVAMLLWCLAETNTKVLNGLNAHASLLVEFALALIDCEALGLGAAFVESQGMEVEGKKGGKKNKKTAGQKRERVPLFVAVAAAQFLNAFLSANPAAHTSIWATNGSRASLLLLLSTSDAPLGKTARTETHAASDPATDAEEWLQLRVLAFGILLQLSSVGGGRKVERTTIRDQLKECQTLLLELVGTDLAAVATASHESLKEEASLADKSTSSAATAKLASYERQLSTLQLSMEVLSEWCASLDAEALGQDAIEDEDEEWGGIAKDGEGDVEMDEEEAEMGEPEDGIIRKVLPMEEDEDLDVQPTLELGASALTLFVDLQAKLAKLAQPSTSLSFAQSASSGVAPAFAPSLLPTSTTADSTATVEAASLLSSNVVPSELAPIADIISTIHVRAIETLNNLYITLARAISAPNVTSFLSSRKDELQQVWESILNLVHRATVPSGLPSTSADAETIEERQREIVMAGTGVAWGLARISHEMENAALIVGQATTPFLLSLFSHPFATATTPAAESIRVRIAGALGWLGRREGVSNEENETIGTFLLSILPLDKSTFSPFNPTPEVLIQSIDSLIDLYADEDSAYDVAVFRSKGFLPRLEVSVSGVRAQMKKIDRKKFPELRTRADGALENLDAFVKYRKNIV
ncbi:BQ5605_C012g06971 [Microbotryum silenes-dioicae]|uniref:BQ5605_C012g06971 protein n=1 Tax=Microbotryum silenes-dioicae TaxID=796604 RepID=A0A2X0NWS0_9BASI|nr:BQ5605_C012g06971 [Microbotryum silenes-dioicae]